MGSKLKFWRESASLILASKRLPPIKPKEGIMNKMLNKKEVKAPDHEEQELLRLLFVRRSGGSSYMPNVCVFPGGMVDDTDFSKEWLDVFEYNSGQELFDLFARGRTGSPIFSRQRDAEFLFVPSELALRVTAIRETFEESGILLARHSEDLIKNGTHTPGEARLGNHFELSDTNLKKWREDVINEPSQFLTMCKELKAVPDVWSLYEWSNWLTPLLTTTHRFDTAFFVSCIDEAPLIKACKGETTEGMWADPAGMLTAAGLGQVSVAPPQMYELCRFVRFGSPQDMLELANHRAKHRSVRWMPVILQCQDAIVFLMPGDDLYPEEPDLTGEGEGKLEMEETIEELGLKYPNQNRAFISFETKELSLSCTLKSLEGHILPRSFNQKQGMINLFDGKGKSS